MQWWHSKTDILSKFKMTHRRKLKSKIKSVLFSSLFFPFWPSKFHNCDWLHIYQYNTHKHIRTFNAMNSFSVLTKPIIKKKRRTTEGEEERIVTMHFHSSIQHILRFTLHEREEKWILFLVRQRAFYGLHTAAEALVKKKNRKTFARVVTNATAMLLFFFLSSLSCVLFLRRDSKKRRKKKIASENLWCATIGGHVACWSRVEYADDNNISG